jgi:hypothetical protein
MDGVVRKYILTLAQLYEVAIDKVGAMDEGSYSDLEHRVRVLAKERGITKPLMVVDVKFKPDVASLLGVAEQPYHISNSEWDAFVRDSKTMTEYMPNVYVVDGERYAAPI